MTSTLPGWEHLYSGKVRDLYRPERTEPDGPMLVVASDRVSAFDFVLEPGIPGKGSVLTQLTLWWFEQLSDVPNHLWRHDTATAVPSSVADRAMLVTPLEMFPVECVVRGYLSGSGWVEYQATQSVCGVPLPAGLRNGDKLPQPIFTPAYKAELGEHDQNITFEQTIELVGEADARALRELSLDVYTRAADVAAERGLILADTKFEFGRHPVSGTITLADEVLTSDSSRYWDAEPYRAQGRTDSFDKQIVRDWLAAHWDKTGEPPVLPEEIVQQTARRYRELFDRLTAH